MRDSGTKPIGRFEVTSELGRGSQGVVHLAHDPQDDREVAIKTILWPHGISDDHKERFSERFQNEMEAAGTLSHPGIVAIYEYDNEPEDGSPYVAMEFVDGPSLHEVICNEGLRIDWSLQAAATMADALQSARDQGIAHPDLKPANILVREDDGAVKIGDFGMVRVDPVMAAGIPNVPGTPAYIAPERILGKPGDIRSDLFSLGVILYEMLCGKLPFEGKTVHALCEAITHNPPIPISQQAAEFGPEHDRFFEHALAKNPADRFADAGEFAEALERIVDLHRDQPAHEEPGRDEQVPSGDPELPTPISEVKSLALVNGPAFGGFDTVRVEEPEQAILDRDQGVDLAPGEKARLWFWGGIAGIVLMIFAAVAWVAQPPRVPAEAASATPEPVAPAAPRRSLAVRSPVPPVERPQPAIEEPSPSLVAPVPEPVKPPVQETQPEPVKPQPTKATSLPEPVPEPVAPEPVVEEPPVVVAPPPEPARLALAVKSGIKNGKLTVLVDGNEVYQAALSSEAKGFARIARKAVNRGQQDLGRTIELEPGEHTITARLRVAGKEKLFEERLELSAVAGERQSVRIVAGKALGRKLSIRLDEPDAE